jgi:hypothetical protein
MPAVNYTAEELLYAPRNARVHKIYGMSPVEQLILTINIVLRRDAQKLSYFTEGNIPEALIGTPAEWQPEHIERFQVMFDALMKDPAQRSRARFVPSGTSFQFVRSDESLFGQADEWFARLICHCFSLPEQPFVKQVNRATAETANESALKQGQYPRMIWFKTVMDRLIKMGWGRTDIEFIWEDEDDMEPKERAEMDLPLVQAGIMSIDEVRARMGLAPIGMKHAIWGIGPQGITFVDDLVRAHQQGLLAIQPPPPPGMMPGQPGMMPGDPNAMQSDPGAMQGDPSAMVPGQPMPGTPGAPGIPGATGGPMPARPLMASDFEGIPPELLAAVGLGNAGGRKLDVTRRDQDRSDPAQRHVGHPEVLRTLRAFEAKHNVVPFRGKKAG